MGTGVPSMLLSHATQVLSPASGKHVVPVTQTASPHLSSDALSLVPIGVSVMDPALGDSSHPGCDLL